MKGSEIVQKLVEGLIVRIDDHVTMQLEGNELVLRCTRCAALHTRYPWQAGPALEMIGTILRFIRDHRHNQPA